MRVNVIDIGCSFTKVYSVEDGKILGHCKLPTVPHRIVSHALSAHGEIRKKFGGDAVIVISTSDSVVVEYKSKEHQWFLHDVPKKWQEGLTPYKKSGHPRNEALRGAANQMLWLLKNERMFNMNRILPVSTYIAALIADDSSWHCWDITHATNSGFYDYDKGGWADEAQPFIEAGLIGKDILPSSGGWDINSENYSVFLGGHDSTFAVANDIPYSTHPYVSCGTWTTVSVESTPDLIEDKGESRFIAAPNGTVLQQLCFLSDDSDEGRAKAVNRVKTFLERKFQGAKAAPVRVFGTWGEQMLYDLRCNSNLRVEEEIDMVNYLPLQAARYVERKS